MIKDISELKALLEWAKAQGIRNLQIGDVKVEFSELAMLHLVPESLDSQKPVKELSNMNTELLSDTAQLTPEEEDDLLFHSAR